MARAPFRRKSGTRETHQLLRLAEGLAKSKSRTEDAYWEHELERLLLQLLETGDDEAINRALDRAHDQPSGTFDTLADMVESLAESKRILSESGPQRLALFCAPLLIWGRSRIPARKLPASCLRDLTVQLGAHIFSSHARFVLADYLLAPDQLPSSYSQAREWLNQFESCLRQGKPMTIDPASLSETPDVVCDMRMLVGAVAAPEGKPMYAWQEATTPVEEAMQSALTAWRQQGSAVLKPLLIGFPFQLEIPRTFFGACRDADLASRSYAIGAGVAYLEAVTATPPEQLTAIVGACWGQGLEEYRIGFSIGESGDIVHGSVWPLITGEDEETQAVEAIEAALKQSGVGNILMLSERLPLEYCEDCGTPLYPNRDGEMLHAHLPEDAAGASLHLH